MEVRLLAQSKETGLSLVRLRKAVVFDRLLARLMVVAAGRWLLKGDWHSTTGSVTEHERPGTRIWAVKMTNRQQRRYFLAARAYGRAGISSTRVKDLIDLVLIRTRARLDAGELRQALDHTFASRGRRQLPARFPPPPPKWGVSYRRMAGEVELTVDLGEGGRPWPRSSTRS